MTVHAAAAHEGHVLSYPKDPLYSRIPALKLGMWLFLLSDAFSFGGLLLAYGILRGGSDYWGCISAATIAKFGCVKEPLLGINFTAVLTFILICSSVSMVLAHAAASEGDRKGTVKCLSATVLGGLLFLCGQAQEYWGALHHVFGSAGGVFNEGLVAEGLLFGKTHYATTFYCITSFHGMHVTTGVLYLSVMLALTAAGKSNPVQIETCGLFWHFVDLVWILVFTFVYLVPYT
jgi:heme/copper-type cytochrome/quinol oxidase subunit 3